MIVGTTVTGRRLWESYVIHCCFAILLGIAAWLPRAVQTPSNAQVFPSVSISVSSDIPSERIQIKYFLIGPFGGYGGLTKPQTGLHSYDIAALADGKAATEIRMIVFASGCEIQTFVIPLKEDSRVQQEFPCQRVATVSLSGQITPKELVRGNDAQLVVMYEAYWGLDFFGITDGIVPQFQVATISPDSSGLFQVDLPYFSTDAAASLSSPRRGSFSLELVNVSTGNRIATLKPEAPELRLVDHHLRVQSQYPDGLKCIAEPF